MSNKMKCCNCKASIDTNNETVNCYTCELGHLLCDTCINTTEQCCPKCGEKVVKRVRDKIVKELYKSTPNDWMKKLENSCTTLDFDEQFEIDHQWEPVLAPPTIIGFKKWPRSFFHKIPNENSNLSPDERALLQNLPNITECETASLQPQCETPFWESLPKSFNDLDMPCEIMKCPITRCGYPICNFDATTHLLLSHDNLPIEMVERYEIAELTLNPMSIRKNEVTALLRILYAGIVTDLGITKHKNCLPLYLLCTRINTLETEKFLKEFENSMNIDLDRDNDCDHTKKYCMETMTDNVYAQCNPWKISDCILLWCAGTIPLNHPLTISISAFPDEETLVTLGTTVNIFSLNSPQSGYEIYKSMERLVTNKNEMDRLLIGKEHFKIRISFL